MNYIFSPDFEPVVQKLHDKLTEALQTQRVLWLVSGGSNIAAAVEAMKSLPEALTKNLAITLTDERYGEVGHKDSNTTQLFETGFDPKQATYVPVLTAGASLEETRQRYEDFIRTALENADVVIGHFGIGADGHIAGILPNSPATTTEGLVAAYEAPNFTRVTLTFAALKQIDVAIAAAFGNEKHEALSKLQNETLELKEQPSQILKQLPEAYVFSDQFEA